MAMIEVRIHTILLSFKYHANKQLAYTGLEVLTDLHMVAPLMSRDSLASK